MAFLTAIYADTPSMSNLFGSLVRQQVFISSSGQQVVLDLYGTRTGDLPSAFMIRLGVAHFPTHYLRFGGPLTDEVKAGELFDATAAMLVSDDIGGWSDLIADRLIEIAKTRKLGLTEVK